MRCLIFLVAVLCSALSVKAQGRFWGMTLSNDSVSGVIFRTDSTGNNYRDVYFFNNPGNGLEPHGSLMIASDGNLYGLTSQGGLYNSGTLFQFNPNTEVYSKKHDFDSLNGSYPLGSLIQASDGKLYGMTHSGGSIGRGVLFEFDISTGIFKKKHDFDMVNGASPHGALMEGSDGKLYALSSQGGIDATGCLLQFDLSTGVVSLKHSFILGSSGEGYDPRGSLIQATNGKCYGFSRYGKAGFKSGGGVVFSFELSNLFYYSLNLLHHFDDNAPGSAFGYEVMGSLTQATNGKLYGMTVLGGNDSAGTIFEYDISLDTLIKLYDFNSAVDGFKPHGSLMSASNGKLYGLTTSEGGQAKLFQFDIASNALTVKADVTGTPYYTTLIETGINTTGVTTYPGEFIKIYPNPTEHNLRIDIPENITIEKIWITDVQGKVVRVLTQPGKTIDVSSLTKGLYHLEILAENNILHREFIRH